MITRDIAKKLIAPHQIIEYTENTLVANIPQVEFILDLIYDSFEQRLCDNCNFDYCGCSIQDSILQIEPEATFTTFGCNSFEPKYRRTECAHAKQKNHF